MLAPTIEQLRAWHDGDEPAPPEMEDAYALVDEMVKHAGNDAAGAYVWHGWVLRWAYLAGVKAERARVLAILESQRPTEARSVNWTNEMFAADNTIIDLGELIRGDE